MAIRRRRSSTLSALLLPIALAGSLLSLLIWAVRRPAGRIVLIAEPTSPRIRRLSAGVRWSRSPHGPPQRSQSRSLSLPHGVGLDG